MDWLMVSPPLKNMKVNWDNYSQYMGIKKMFQTTKEKWCVRQVHSYQNNHIDSQLLTFLLFFSISLLMKITQLVKVCLCFPMTQPLKVLMSQWHDTIDISTSLPLYLSIFLSIYLSTYLSIILFYSVLFYSAVSTLSILSNLSNLSYLSIYLPT